MKKVFLIVKTNKQKEVCENDRKNKLNSKRGSELAQTVLITAIMVVIIATLFFPQIQSLFNTSMTKLSTWFNSILNGISSP